MPRKPASTVPATTPVDSAEKEGASARRSTRIAEKPPSSKPASTAAAPKKKRSTAEKEGEPSAKEGPPAKKTKSDDETEKKAEKPASKAKPTSKAGKPASTKGKPTSKVKASGKAAAAAKKNDAPAVDTAATAEEKADEPMPSISEEKPVEEAPTAAEAASVADTEMKDADAAPAAAPAETTTADAAPEAAKEDAKEEEVKELQVGDVLPAWTFKNEKNEDVDVGKLAGEQGLVLFLVPKANTPGCTTQACGFRDSYPDFQKSGYAVYCLSADTPNAQGKWQEKQKLPYSLISDPKRKLIAALGAKNGTSTKRSHFIFEKGTGKLVEKKPSVKPAESPKLALDFITLHHAN